MRGRWWAPALVALLTAWPGVADAQQRFDCSRCHAELELLRQNVASLERARALLASDAMVAASAHGEMGCGDCHQGYTAFPHDLRPVRTSGCADCHEDAAGAYRTSVHAESQGAVALEGARCADCHGVHDVLPVSRMGAPANVGALNARCTTCHQTVALAATNPHGGDVACSSCHGAHAIRPPDEPGSSLTPVEQPETCGACHDTVAHTWRQDTHGRALLEDGPVRDARWTNSEVPPACTSCHGGHDMVPAASVEEVERCGACHEEAARTFFGSYHGKAAALGSTVAATCADCHGAHTILPTSNPASSVADARLVETCGSCHEHARPAFVEYDAHPDPLNRERNPWLFYSFVFMNVLLVGVLGVFGLHTLMWWVRLEIDKRRGAHHGGGEA